MVCILVVYMLCCVVCACVGDISSSVALLPSQAVLNVLIRSGRVRLCVRKAVRVCVWVMCVRGSGSVLIFYIICNSPLHMKSAVCACVTCAYTPEEP